MNITSVQVRVHNREGSKVKAFASVLFDDAFVVHDIKLIDGKNGLFMVMPQRRLPNGQRKDIAHAINQETRSMIEEAVISKYEEELENIDSEEEYEEYEEESEDYEEYESDDEEEEEDE